MGHDVFLSYSHLDKPAADAACATLEAAGIRCWIAPRDISPGAEWGAAIIKAIDNAAVMVLIFSINANNSRQVRREVERAVSSGVTIVPIRVTQADPEGALAYFLAGVHWLDALTPPLETHLRQLARSVGAFLDAQRDGSREASDRVLSPFGSEVVGKPDDAGQIGRGTTPPKIKLSVVASSLAVVAIVAIAVVAIRYVGPTKSGDVTERQSAVVPAPHLSACPVDGIVSFAKVMSPALAADYQGISVKTVAQVYNIGTDLQWLPESRSYILMFGYPPGEMGVGNGIIAISKSRADGALALHPGDVIYLTGQVLADRTDGTYHRLAPNVYPPVFIVTSFERCKT